MSDRRRELLLQELKKTPDVNGGFVGIYNAMDEYFKERALELLQFTFLNITGHSIDEKGNIEIKYKGEWITKEQLFENFL